MNDEAFQRALAWRRMGDAKWAREPLPYDLLTQPERWALDLMSALEECLPPDLYIGASLSAREPRIEVAVISPEKMGAFAVTLEVLLIEGERAVRGIAGRFKWQWEES